LDLEIRGQRARESIISESIVGFGDSVLGLSTPYAFISLRFKTSSWPQLYTCLAGHYSKFQVLVGTR